MSSPTEDDLPIVDPARGLRTSVKLFAAVLRTPVGRWTSIELAPRIDPTLLRISRGKVSSGMVLPTALLTTIGAKSGAERVNPVLYFHDGDDVVVIASSYGRDTNPAWFHNLRAHPRVRLSKSGGGRWRTAEVVDDEAELARLWALADSVFPLFADYRRRAAEVGRTIPVIRIS
ncbi:nitroreductase/quinone reductase family protein [Gordonia neofelifaecis]|uniref:Deazaflavin-dependent nitroreductase family protein n=1 Tax=Gordonia neofelifaecis NRRL B-59395 TaxID=644548 RepID=F1YLH9_9ACTN|nr:nitroreductase/quinone reductase family protein [Gordonia neofelifaecis]EGD54373.1 hypothetical protein SCNU_13854 [Gordonia neofelifaecis NRRL B-59395]